MVEKGQRGFEDLECYQLAQQVLLEAYKTARLLPLEERWNLADQMRRAATSVTLNIAEGYGRYHYLDSLRFYYQARGSLCEVLSAFANCDELGYSQGVLSRQREMCPSALRSLYGFIRYVREQRQGFQEYGSHALHEEGLTYEASPDSPEAF